MSYSADWNTGDSSDNITKLNRLQIGAETDGFTVTRYQQFAAALGSGFAGTVLDVGSATGRGGEAFRARIPGVTLDGVELVPERAKALEASSDYRRVYGGVLQSIDAEPGSYDAILMGEVVEHVPYSELEQFLSASRRLLVIGGRLLLTTPNPHYILLKQRSGGSVLGGAHVSVHCAEALSQYLSVLGFTVNSIAGTGKVSKVIGRRFPLNFYGAYLIDATAS